MYFARNMRRNREPVADPLASRRGEDLLISGGHRDHFWKSRPRKSDARQMTCAMDRIDRSQLLSIEPLGPTGWIIVDPDRAARSPDVHMVGQGEIFEAEVATDFAECAGKCVGSLKVTNISDKCIYTVEHAAFGFAWGRCSKSTSVPRRLS